MVPPVCLPDARCGPDAIFVLWKGDDWVPVVVQTGASTDTADRITGDGGRSNVPVRAVFCRVTHESASGSDCCTDDCAHDVHVSLGASWFVSESNLT